MEIRSTSPHAPVKSIWHKDPKRPKGKDFNLFCTKAGAHKLQLPSKDKPRSVKIQVGVIECYSSIPNDSSNY